MKNKILIIDDTSISRELLYDLLIDKYDVVCGESGSDALKYIRELRNELSAVLLDLHMADMSGFEVCQTLKKENIIDSIPIIITTADTSLESEIKCFELGCYDYIRKPFSQILLQKRIENAVSLHEKNIAIEKTIANQNILLKNAAKQLMGKAESGTGKEIEEAIEVIGSLCEYRKFGKDKHVQNIKAYTHIIGTSYMELYPDCGLTKDALNIIRICSPLHDIGKIELPERIVIRPGRLTDDEFRLMQSHTSRGCDMIKHINLMWNADYSNICYEICRSHHERFDGRGYPDKLAGDAIPLSAQIVGLADVYDALITDTNYREAIPKNKAFSMIINGECGVFSPKLMEAFVQSKEGLEAVTEEK